jgi:hypothetical protein
MTAPGSGGGIPRPGAHASATTYPLDHGIAIVGGSGTTSSPASGQGFKIALRIGGGNDVEQYSGGPWGARSSRFGTAILIRDYENYGINFQARLSGSTATAINVLAGAGEVLARGGLVTKTQSTVPTDLDVDNDIDGHLIVDTTLNRLWVRSGGRWRYVALR